VSRVSPARRPITLFLQWPKVLQRDAIKVSSRASKWSPPMTPKRPRDPNQLAKSIIDIATGQKPNRDPTTEEQGEVPAVGASELQARI
jgi:hypothetical protein